MSGEDWETGDRDRSTCGDQTVRNVASRKYCPQITIKFVAIVGCSRVARSLRNYINHFCIGRFDQISQLNPIMLYNRVPHCDSFRLFHCNPFESSVAMQEVVYEADYM